MIADTTVAPESLGLWLLCAAAIVGLIHYILGSLVHWKSLRSHEKVQSGERLVTRSELRENLSEMATKIRELAEYTHDSVHELRGGVHNLQLRLEALKAQVHEEVIAANRPLEAKLESHTIALTRMLTLLESDQQKKPLPPVSVTGGVP